MKRLAQLIFLSAFVPALLSCSDVNFHSKKNTGGGGNNPTSCEPNCPPGTTYSWFEGGYNQCSKACGGGNQTQVVECRRTSDNVVVADGLCTGAKPASSRSCNVQACANTYNWNAGPYGNCSQVCGGGQRTRNVICQDQNGATVAEGNCLATTPKPATSEPCNTQVCPPVTYDWNVVAGPCSVQCGGGTAADTVTCLRNDGVTVPDSNCNAATKPPTTRTCNTHACPQVYTYVWEPGSWSTCSKPCGTGAQTRSIACKRNDGAYVPENLCVSHAGAKPASTQNCNTMACPTGRAVTQTETVPPAQNQLDVILIIDDSASMKQDQTKLATRLNGLITDLNSLNIDYQVCLTTTDIKYYKGSPIKWKYLNSFIMNKNSPNKNQVFVETIDSLGAEWSSEEQGIKAQYLMIRDFKSSGCIRAEATLTTIVVSDEDEFSVAGNAALSSEQYRPLTAENYPDTLINFVKSTYNIGGFKKPFIWNSIIVKPGDSVCEAAQDAQSSPSFPGTFYNSLSIKTGGHVGSICDGDYTQSLKYIKEKAVNSMPGLTLECTPTDTPIVTFNPNFTTAITLTGDKLKFTPALPENTVVTVKYTCPN